MKKGIQRGIILLLIFVTALVAAFFFFGKKEEEDTMYEGMGKATLPVVYPMLDGQRINRMYGYTREMKEEYMREDLTPLEADGTLGLSVDCYGDTIEAISYTLREASSQRLIESKEIEEWETISQATNTGNQVKLNLQLHKLLNQKEEYLLRICLDTKEDGKIYYYTRILYEPNSHWKEMLDFVTYFSNRTLEEEEKQEGKAELSTYIEPDKTGDNSSFACVNIHSNHHMLTWGNLKPRRVGATSVKIKQLTGSIGTIRLSYQVEAAGETGLTETYQVEEAFVVRYSPVRFYLLGYERRANQIFQASNDTISQGIVELGILEGEQVQLKTSDSGTYTVFSVNGELWSYSSKKNEAIKVFSFREEKNWVDVRASHEEHDFRIIDVQDTGDCSFLVYGYMNSGSHQGEVSMIFYRYIHGERALEEIFYVPAHTTYSLLQQEVGTLNYISDTGLIYVMAGNAVYAIDVVGSDQMVIVDQLEKKTFVSSQDNSIISWQEGENPFAARSLALLFLKDGKKKTIQAQEGTCLKPLGFIGSDFVYGIARESELGTDSSGQRTFPMFAIEIVDGEGQILTHYEKKGYYLQEVEISEGRIQIYGTDNQGRGEDFSDVMLLNEASAPMLASVLTERNSSLKKKVYAINLSQYQEESRLTIQTPVRLLGSSLHQVHLAMDVSVRTDPRYFSYAYGNLVEISYDLSTAIHQIYEKVGVVMDAGQNLIWARGVQAQEAKVTISPNCVTEEENLTLAPAIEALLETKGIKADVKSMVAKGDSIRQIMEEKAPGSLLDLTGCSLQEILYYISDHKPVLLLTGNSTADLIVGYDNYNITFFQLLTGAYYKMGRNDTAAYIETKGAHLFTCR